MTPGSAPTLADVAAHWACRAPPSRTPTTGPNQLSPTLREKVLAAARGARLHRAGPDGARPAPRADRHARARLRPAADVHVHRPRRRRSSCAGSPPARGARTGADARPADARGAGALRRARALRARRRLRHVLHRGRRPALRGGAHPGPAVRAHRVRRRPGAAVVQIDDENGAAAAARHLVALGHRASRSSRGTRTGTCATGPERPGALALPRAVRPPPRVARPALESGGIDWSGVLVSGAGGSDAAGGARAAAALLDRADRPTAILAPLRRPGDRRHARPRPSAGSTCRATCRVVGFDDIPQAAATTPGLTTVSQPHDEKGGAAVRLLVSGARPEDSSCCRATSSSAPRRLPRPADPTSDHLEPTRTKGPSNVRSLRSSPSRPATSSTASSTAQRKARARPGRARAGCVHCAARRAPPDRRSAIQRRGRVACRPPWRTATPTSC